MYVLPDPPRPPPPEVKIPPWVVWVFILTGAVGCLVHTISQLLKSETIFDAVALAWLGVTLIGILLPHVSEGGFGALSFKLRRNAELQVAAKDLADQSDRLQKVLADTTDLLSNWTGSISWLNGWLQSSTVDPDVIRETVARFCKERMEEAVLPMALENERVRSSLWWLDEEKGGLVLLYSNDLRDQATLDHVFRPGNGLMGQALLQRKLFNIRDAPQSQYFQQIEGAPSEYHGLLLIPIWFADQVVGMLSVDRENREQFNKNAKNIASALADIIGAALTHPESLPYLRG